MAELDGRSFLSSFFDAIFERLASSNLKDYFGRVNLETLVKKLESPLDSIKQVLDDAEIKQYESPKVKKWVGDVKHAMYEADQLLDEIATDAALKKLKAESQLSTGNNVLGFFPPFVNNSFKSRIQELLKSLDSLAEQTGTLGLKQGTCCARNKVGLNPKPSKRVQTSLVDESGIYGRKGDKEKIINFLLDSDSGNRVPVTSIKENDKKEIINSLLLSDEEEENDSGNQGLEVMSIVGLGGMGKTALAQLVYNDHMIKQQFELKAWVYVPESFDVIALTKAILRSFKSPTYGEDLELLQQRLRRKLTGKKYLLVLDDVKNGNGENLEQLLLPFNHGSFGSKIVVTTRYKEVASDLESNKLLDLQQLDNSDCWKLFVRHAFHGKNVSQHPILESIGKTMVDKCRGLPLAVKTLGKLLRKRFSQREWVKVLDTDLWRLWDGDINFNPVLRLGYHNLDANLKRCFAYCSIFPKGYQYKKDGLIKLWMAEGLRKCCDTDEREEELGSKFFDDLESISFFQKSPKEWASTDRLYFVMHDLVNDLAKLVSGEFCLQIEVDGVQDIPEWTRHISCFLEKDGRKISLDHVYKIEDLRSLMVQSENQLESNFFSAKPFYNCTTVQHDLFSRLKYLRMLSFYGCELVVVADEISNLKLLRYLDLSCTGIKKLADSLCMLYNLQTLILRYCELTELPSDFYKLVNLLHLDLLGNCIKKMPKQIGSLNHLHTLTDFVVGEQSGCDIKELAKLNHLQGKLKISGLENVIDPTDAAEANLKDKKHLEELRMSYNSGGGEIDNTIIEREVSVLEALQPNSNLNSLSIYRYRGSRFPNWLGDCHIPNLVSLELFGCDFSSQFPSLGQLPSLKELHIQYCNGIEIIGEEFYGNNSSSNVPFKSLEYLSFEDMWNWKEWLCVEGCFPMLKVLFMEHCHKLKMALPQHLPSLQILQIRYCDELEASIPEADNLNHLELQGCKILVNELPSSLKRVILRGGIRFPAWSSTSLQQNLFNGAFLEVLWLNVSGFAECSSSLDLRCCSSTSPLRQVSMTGWRHSSLPFARLSTNLQSLQLYDCPQLESFPEGGLPSCLSQLVICNCPKLIASREEWGLLELNSLKTFGVGDEFENVESFPEENLLPPTLDTLWLQSCSKLRIINSKGLLHLESLKALSIHDCPCLECLPEEGIPNSLSVLEIISCSQLEQLYQKEGGERWHKIRHIPKVAIDYEQQN